MEPRAGVGGGSADAWSEILASEERAASRRPQQPCYTRRRRIEKSKKQDLVLPEECEQKYNPVGFAAPTKRVSWNRSLSTRGRTSVAVAACVIDQPGQKKARRKGKPPVPKGKVVQPLSLEKEKLYFQEIDAFELEEESPSPEKYNTWVSGNQIVTGLPHLSSRLEKWLIAKKLNFSCEPSTTLTKILESPGKPSGLSSELPPKALQRTDFPMHSILRSFSSNMMSRNLISKHGDLESRRLEMEGFNGEGCGDLDTAIKKLSLSSTCDSSDSDQLDPFTTLLAVCGQSSPVKLLDVFCNYCAPESITKLGEGTFGEAFQAGNFVCKIVPIDGEFPVNGELQKRSEELLEEVVLSQTLNQLRVGKDGTCNACTTFIETKEVKVCQGLYDVALIKAWEDWDEKNCSENDPPIKFPETQRYVVFVLEHGGRDLESFVLLNFDEARSLLVQVTMALAVAEAAYEFEHRDLHWGNVLLSRNDSVLLRFTLEGKPINVKTCGLGISIIDFTLSRINTGKDILFLDLSADPALFEGPRGDKQSETYRRMKKVTGDRWEGSFPKTNVLWLMYLVDILLLKKSYERSLKDERQLRSFKKNLDQYGSSKEAIFDSFFSDLFVDRAE